MNSSVVIIVQARMTSQRLPGKVLMEVMDKPLLGLLLDRLNTVKCAQKIVIATTTNASDQPIVDFCQKQGFTSYRGSEDDVLHRYYEAAKVHEARHVVRITADCPLIDPALVDDLITQFQGADPKVDYMANLQPRMLPRGMDAEIFTFQALQEAHEEAQKPYEREHVTPFLYRHPERYRIGTYRTRYPDLSDHRWTVDEPEDFTLISKICEALYPDNPLFSFEDILALFDEHPEWKAINAHISQRPR